LILSIHSLNPVVSPNPAAAAVRVSFCPQGEANPRTLCCGIAVVV
jgi:hypothetical protein